MSSRDPGTDTQHVLSLCDRTGNMVRPWAEAGHICIAVDLAHEGVSVENVGDGTIVYVEADVNGYEAPDVEYAAAFAFPPCTDLAYSGARWFDEKGWQAFGDALALAGSCRDTLESLDCPWMVENPASRLQKAWGDPDWRFHPYQYDSYTLEDDKYTKETWLWSGSGFRMPVPLGVNETDADDRIHTMSPGEDRSEKRAETPMGFARAVFLAHQDPERYAKAGTGREQADIQEMIA